MTDCYLKPYFLETSAGRIFVLLRAPRATDRCVIVVPPFAEEMNKSRRQLALTANALTNAGFAVALPDLFGTGDSEGDFADADWLGWSKNIQAVVQWVENTGYRVEALLAVRLGCLLAADTLSRAGIAVERSIFWQPVDNGARYMKQFLRLRAASSMMEDRSESVAELRGRLDGGEVLEVAGYPLTMALWRSIEGLELSSLLGRALGELHLIEVGQSNNDRLSAAGQRLAGVARESGVAVLERRLAGDPFWIATEIVVNQSLVDATVASLTNAAG